MRTELTEEEEGKKDSYENLYYRAHFKDLRMDNITKDYGAVANPNRFSCSVADQGKKGNGSAGGFGSAAVSRNKQGPAKSEAEAASPPMPKNTTNKLGVVKKRLLLISQLKEAENSKSRLPRVFVLGGRHLK